MHSAFLPLRVCLAKKTRLHYLCNGKLAEWSIAAVLKTVEVRASGGSNPSLSAERAVELPVFFEPKQSQVCLALRANEAA